MSIGICLPHAIIDAINMAPCIEHICIYLLCTCATSFHVGMGGGAMQSFKHHATCNMFENIYICSDRVELYHATIAAFKIAQST